MQAEIDHIREIETLSRGAAALRPRDPIVTESWHRCLTKHGLDPARRSEAYILPESRLRLHRQRSEELIAIARTGIDDLYRLVAGQDYVLMLADSDGVTVEYLGEERQKADLRRAGLYLGGEWSEARAGTCALGACIESGDALIIHQSDHFDVTHGALSCTAAPIYDTGGRLTAVLDISLLSSPVARESQHLALNLVRQTARRVEMANIMAESRSDWVLRLGSNPDFLDVDPEAALRLDAGGHVIGMTHGAAQLMARALHVDWRQNGQLIGRHVSEIFALDLTTLEGLTRQRLPRDRLVETRDGIRLFAHAIEPRRPVGPPARPMTRPRLAPRLRALAGDDPAMQRLLAQAAAAADTRMPLILSGEPGTGRSTLAQAIHDLGSRGPLVTVPCAALADDEAAVVFGRADRRRSEPGLIDQAAGGTLVLDGIGDLPPRLMARMLPLLRDGSFRPLGSLRERPSRARVIAICGADTSPLQRITALHLALPSLRDRQDRLDLVRQHFARACGGAVAFDPAALARLAQLDWPGNLHDLGSLALSVAAGRAPGDTTITTADLPEPAAPPAAAEAEHLRWLLVEHRWNVSAVARALGLDRSTVHRQIRRHGLTRN
ncbi:sigma-54-dependent Fis family transcriptional regulator [Frigidibacter sp. MR17.14]|uniref:sigma-54-dependent Fis family transcriptional regulator n=1 Tax=Frigidibacter sp. MR17.14 TaxID=3126509 RepID=UPI003012F405